MRAHALAARSSFFFVKFFPGEKEEEEEISKKTAHIERSLRMPLASISPARLPRPRTSLVPRRRKPGRRLRRSKCDFVIENKNRILFTESELSSVENNNTRIHLHASDARYEHLKTVLNKINVGDEFKLTVLNDCLAVGKIIESTEEDGVLIELSRNTDTVKEKMGAVSVLLAMPRPKVLRRLLTVFAQFGLENVYLFSAEKTERFYFQSDVLTEETLIREFTRGVEQNAVDVSFPNVSKCRGLKVVLEELMKEDRVDLAKRVKDNKGSDFEWLLSRREEEDNRKRSQRTRVNLVAHPSNDSVSVTEAIHTALRRKKSVTSSLSDSSKKVDILLAIGPEGGWSEKELQTFDTFDFVNVGLGNRVFSTDVATIALLSFINEYLEYG